MIHVRYHFCWVCEQYFDYKTYKHSCGRYKEEDKSSETARKSLKRYLFYYERYKVHEDSLRRQENIRVSIQEKIYEIHKLKPHGSWIDTHWLQTALETLFTVS